MCVCFTFLNPEEERVVAENGLEEKVTHKAFIRRKKGECDKGKEHTLREEEEENEKGKEKKKRCFSFVPDILCPETAYTVRVRTETETSGNEGGWSEEAEFTTPKFSECCVWKKCPYNVDVYVMYSVDEMNPRTATKINYETCTIIGNTALPQNKVTSWSIKILKSKNNDGSDIFIGVAPSDINQNENCNYWKCGWYFRCYDSKLYSGPPHNYNGWKEYGPRKGKEKDNTFTQETVWEL